MGRTTTQVIFAAAALTLCLAGTASAQREIRSAASASFDLREGEPTLSYYCGEECLLARFTCTGFGFAIPRRELGIWLIAGDDGFAPLTVDLLVDARPTTLTVHTLTYDEFSGEWFAWGSWTLEPAFGAALQLAVIAPALSTILIPAANDPESRVHFVNTCAVGNDLRLNPG